jgi:hypothetical protein
MFMKQTIAFLALCIAAATAFGQATVMVNTNTGAIRYPTNFIPANGIATTTTVNQASAVTSNRMNGYESAWKIGSTGAVLKATTNFISVTGVSTPVNVIGNYFETANYFEYQSSNSWYFWYDNYLGYVLSTNIGSTNGYCWIDSTFQYFLWPYNGATGELTWAEATGLPAAQIGAGTNWEPGVLKWGNQRIADGTVGLYIGGQLWTNALAITNLTFIKTADTNGSGGLVLTTGTVNCITIK